MKLLLDMSPQTWTTKEKNKQVGVHQTKSFSTAKETTNKTKRQPTEWEKTFTNDRSNKGLISKIYKKLNTHTQTKKSK